LNTKSLQITTFTLLSILIVIAGSAIIYTAVENTAEIFVGLGIALMEMGLLGVLYENVIKKMEKEKEHEEDQIEKSEGRHCKTERLTLYLNLKEDSGILEVNEEEYLRFIRNKQFSPLIYLDALTVRDHWVEDKPRIEAYLETTNRRHTLIDKTNTEKHCHIHQNAYTCKNPTSIQVEKNQEVLLNVVRRYRVNELTSRESLIMYNRQIWRPTRKIEIVFPSELVKTYSISININDYNNDIIDAVIRKADENNQTRYTLELNKKGRRRFYIMDKVVVTMKKTNAHK